MKKIGFVDYFISEWHANNYPAWIERICAEMGADYKVAYAWAELDTSPVDGISTAEWCEKFGAERCATIDELCEKSDVIVILSPSNPETHLRYAEAVMERNGLRPAGDAHCRVIAKIWEDGVRMEYSVLYIPLNG